MDRQPSKLGEKIIRGCESCPTLSQESDQGETNDQVGNGCQHEPDCIVLSASEKKERVCLSLTNDDGSELLEFNELLDDVTTSDCADTAN